MPRIESRLLTPIREQGSEFSIQRELFLRNEYLIEPAISENDTFPLFERLMPVLMAIASSSEIWLPTNPPSIVLNCLEGTVRVYPIGEKKSTRRS